MKEQFENQEARKLKDKTNLGAVEGKNINHLAEKAAEKATITEQLYDKDNPIFSK